MPSPEPPRVGYVVKRYPRYSETFVVREILAHERAGLAIDIFCLRASNDGHFQDLIARVRAPVHYLQVPTASGRGLRCRRKRPIVLTAGLVLAHHLLALIILT